MPTCEPRKKDGNASVGCTENRHAAQEGRIGPRVWTVCRADRRPMQERWKRMCGVLVTPTWATGKKYGNLLLALFAVLLRKQRKRWKRVVGLLATWSSCPGKKDGNVSLDCSQCRQASQEKKMETRVWAACHVDMRVRGERRNRVWTVCRVGERSMKEKWKRIGQNIETRVRAVRRGDMGETTNCGNAWSG